MFRKWVTLNRKITIQKIVYDLIYDIVNSKIRHFNEIDMYLFNLIKKVNKAHDEKTSLYKSEKLKHDEFSHTTSSFIYMITGTLNNIESERYETEEEKNKRLQREADKAVARAIEHDLEEIFDPGFDLTKVRRDD